jgi:hypothetical protein
MVGPFIEHALDVSSQRHIGDEMMSEQFFALVDLGLHEVTRGPGSTNAGV